VCFLMLIYLLIDNIENRDQDRFEICMSQYLN